MKPETPCPCHICGKRPKRRLSVWIGNKWSHVCTGDCYTILQTQRGLQNSGYYPYLGLRPVHRQ